MKLVDIRLDDMKECPDFGVSVLLCVEYITEHNSHSSYQKIENPNHCKSHYLVYIKQTQ